jgi:hypothetical protein
MPFEIEVFKSSAFTAPQIETRLRKNSRSAMIFLCRNERIASNLTKESKKMIGVLDKERVGEEDVRNQQQLENYLRCPTRKISERIERARRKLGSRVVILGHHYQRDDVIEHADLTGDSYQLSVMAAQRKDAEFIVFCGVHFMAESADILGQPQQKVILPDLGAGCSMADMATVEQVEDAWEQLREIGVLEQKSRRLLI